VNSLSHFAFDLAPEEFADSEECCHWVGFYLMTLSQVHSPPPGFSLLSIRSKQFRALLFHTPRCILGGVSAVAYRTEATYQRALLKTRTEVEVLISGLLV
jgi:hypothetical protein